MKNRLEDQLWENFRKTGDVSFYIMHNIIKKRNNLNGQ